MNNELFAGIGPGSEVKIEWVAAKQVDVRSMAEGIDFYVAPRPAECFAYGFVARYVGECLYIIQAMGLDSTTGGLLIPLGCITKITKMRTDDEVARPEREKGA